MRISRSALRVSLCAAFLAAVAADARAQSTTDAATPGTLRSYSTIYSIGLEWDLLNDLDHDAAATVQYRVSGATVWTSALPLVRVDFNGVNMLAGSVLSLAPATEYTVRVSLSDPDGGAETRLVTVRTRAVPAPPTGGRVLHVVPGAGGGDGSLLAPFAGVPAAQASARAGDTFLLHAGSYGGRVRFDVAGTAADYIVWKAAGDGEVLMNGIDIAASHIWLEGITVRDQAYATFSLNAPTNVVVTRCNFFNNHYSIYLQRGGSYWYIADNTIVGDTPASSESFAGEGIELNTTSGHTVAHNSITNVGDGISYPNTNVDIFGNDIFDTSDDGIEADNGGANVRMWGNRIHNAVHNGISFQPQTSGPWYIVRNQIVGNKESAFKFRTTDRFVLLHNTIVNWGGTSLMCCNEGHLLRAFARNNLWISVKGGQIWGFDAVLRDWRTDIDYDGFDWGTVTNPFMYGGWTYPDVWSFSNASGLETHAVRVSKALCFEDFQVPGPSPTPVPPHSMSLRAGCEAVDAGAVLPNINNGFAGTAPDLGAHEHGHAPAVYGPRPVETPNEPPTVRMTAPLAGATFTEPAAITITASPNDPDGTISSVQFFANGAPIGVRAAAPWSLGWTNVIAGNYTLTARATDNRGAVTTSAPVAISVVPPSQPPGSGGGDIVLYAKNATVAAGWEVTSDASAAGGARLQNPNAAAAKVATPLAVPAHYFEMTFNAEADRGYRLWMRGKAASNSWANDSVYVQFDRSVDQAGAAVYRIGTTSATTYTLEDCTGCGLSGWGWQDNGFGTGVLGPLVYFAQSGAQRIRVQVREDGLGIDQIVLSPEAYVAVAPGATKNDGIILPVESPSSQTDVVLHAANATVRAGWTVTTDATAAAGARLQNANAGAAKVATPLASPTQYFEMTFNADAGIGYRLWMRGKAASNSWANDSVYVQFDRSVDQGGTAVYRIGTASATTYTLEDCTGCGVSGWGWQDNGFGAGVLGPLVYFAQSGTQRIRVQVREDGLGIDQLVLSPEKYRSSAPGPTKNDATILPESALSRRELVLYAKSATALGGWAVIADATAAGGARMQNSNAGAAKVATPLASPTQYFDMTFNAEAGIGYRLWMRGTAASNNWANDSAFVQFAGSVDQAGQPIYRIGTTSATTYTLEDCTGCGLSGWGWQDNGFGTGVLGPLVYFAESGAQRIRVQVREDGLAVDQIVLSAEKYLSAPPGSTKNDTTILPQ
jgi:hypothetical protein